MRKFTFRKPIIRKRSFLLLELLLSLALIALCLFPLLKPQAAMRKADMANLEEMQWERVAQAAFCKVKVMLYENQIPWSALKKGVSGELDDGFTLERKGNYSCRYTIRKLDSSYKKNQTVGLVVEIDLNFTPHPLNKKEPHFQRTLYLEEHAA